MPNHHGFVISLSDRMLRPDNIGMRVKVADLDSEADSDSAPEDAYGNGSPPYPGGDLSIAPERHQIRHNGGRASLSNLRARSTNCSPVIWLAGRSDSSKFLESTHSKLSHLIPTYSSVRRCGAHTARIGLSRISTAAHKVRMDLQRTGRVAWLRDAAAWQASSRAPLPSVRLLLDDGTGLDLTEPAKTKRISVSVSLLSGPA